MLSKALDEITYPFPNCTSASLCQTNDDKFITIQGILYQNYIFHAINNYRAKLLQAVAWLSDESPCPLTEGRK